MKISKPLLAPLAGLAMLSAPAAAAAQDGAEEEVVETAEADLGSGAEEMDQAMAMLGSMFPAEPLTAEQQGRLPQAQRIINRMIPEGTLGEMMGGMFDRLLGPMLAAGGAPAMGVVTEGLGIEAAELNLEPAQAEELAALFDASYVERHEREMAMFPTVMRELMTVMEPTMRKAMSELYAIHFTQTELDGIEAFFQTEIGTAYARKSFTMSSDPRIISATMESMPQLMGAFAGIEEKMAAAGADLPPKRSFDALSAEEQARVVALTGLSAEEIKAALAEQAAE